MRPPSQPWPKTTIAKNTLFFAQLMREQLSETSHESFKARSLSTVTRLNEVEIVALQVDRGLPRPSLDPVIQELVWSLEGDPIADYICGDHISTVSSIITNNRTKLQDIINIVGLVRSKMETNYGSILEREILNEIPKERNRIQLRTLTSLYATHLINSDFDRNYILEYIEGHFFRKRPSRVQITTVFAFFQNFDPSTKPYTTYSAVSPAFGRHLSRLGFKIVRTSALPEHAKRNIGQARLEYAGTYLQQTVEKTDPHSAGHLSRAFLQNIKAIAEIADQGTDFSWDPKIYVAAQNARNGVIAAPNRRTDRRGRARSSAGRRLRTLQDYTRRVFVAFERESSIRLITSIDTAVSSHNSPEDTSRLIGYWSGLEVLLSDPDAEGPRIAHYLDLVSPMLCHGYARQLFSATQDALSVNYRKALTPIYAAATSADQADHALCLATILLLPEHEAQREEFVSIVKDNPLALHRLWKLRQDFINPSTTLSTIDSHEQRVRWQVGRIYRARNSIVHGSPIPPFLDTITDNMESYYRLIIERIIMKSIPNNRTSNIDFIAKEYCVEHETVKKKLSSLKKMEQWTSGNLNGLMHE